MYQHSIYFITIGLSNDFKIELLSMDGNFEIDYDLKIEALIYVKVKVTNKRKSICYF